MVTIAPDLDFLLLLVPTIAAVSLTPGMCMTLAFSLGLAVGYRRTLWMMVGELAGVALVVSASLAMLIALVGVDPVYLTVLSVVGGAYLLWIAWQLWHAHDRFRGRHLNDRLGPGALALLGFTTAVTNPKGWAFMLALLPGFIALDRPVAPQLAVFLAVMLTTEFLSMSLYAGGGRWLGRLLKREENLRVLNRVAAVLMLAVSLFVMLQL